MCYFLAKRRLEIIGVNSLIQREGEPLHVSKGLILFHSDLKVSSIDGGAMRILGHTKQSVKGKLLSDLLNKDALNILLKYTYSVIQEGIFVQHEMKLFENPDQWVNVIIYPIDANHFSMLFLDINKQKETEAALYRQTEKLNVLNDSAAMLTSIKNPKELLDSLFHKLSQVLDLDIYINYSWDKEQNRLVLTNHHGICNEELETFMYLEKGTAVCGTVAQNKRRMVFEHLDGRGDKILDLIRLLGVKSYVCEPLLSFGELVGTISFGSKKRSTFTSEELDLIHSICHQVTIVLDRMTKVDELTQNTETLEVANLHLKENERKLRLMIEKNEVERESKTKTNFLAMISHELRTPLNSIIGYSQVLESDQKDPLTDKQKSRLAKILSSSRHLLQLINNILELIRIDTNPETIKTNVKPIRIKDAVWDSLHAVSNNAKEKGISLYIEKDVEDITIEIDPIRFQQVMVNLLNNAIKYNKKNGTVTLYWRVDGRYLAIFVKDTGIGIPQSHHDNIFEPFYRVNHAIPGVEGTGIGLTLVKQNVLEMKGTVGVSSIEGTGSTFWVKVPI
ncbi:GAF domain-containing sensor histidine kinase [Sutcliffiella horikoshii]|uniref:histidine kinase n=1 Tax=Sutcliffiella horikoshii TaxID=79883 RepID=A0AA95B712_9BACI|nr:GAF domain-containing sensor histidine kinase [Sutcliffiella horikoshii]